jgi:hypothetical protein
LKFVYNTTSVLLTEAPKRWKQVNKTQAHQHSQQPFDDPKHAFASCKQESRCRKNMFAAVAFHDMMMMMTIKGT